MPIASTIDHVIDRAIEYAAQLHFEMMWVPIEYLDEQYLFGQDERVFTFQTFRTWLKDSFFQNTGDYTGLTWLNRHVFAHGTSSTWQQSANFSRLIVALTTLAFVESWVEKTPDVTVFFPDMNDDSKLLWQQALVRARTQFALSMSEQETYQKHGRLVPAMPTDNGVLLRKAILTEDCIRDLVRPLREAGWQVQVNEPDERALYMTVRATSDDRQISVALLFSCGTDNGVYRQLAQTEDAILYRGAPYHQEQYALGINVHVGPVTGWRPPDAPGRSRPPRFCISKLVRRLGNRVFSLRISTKE